MTLAGDARVAYLQLWPHARPFHYRYPQPMLRAAPDGMAVAETLARAMIAAANARGEAAQAPDRAAKPAYAYDAAAPAFG